MALASSNRAQVRYIEETVFGVTPAAGNPKNLRVTGESLDFSISSETSKEIRSDRQTTDTVQVGASASGGVNFELSYAEFDPLIEAVLQDTWVHYGTAGAGAALSLGIDSTARTLTAGVAPTGNDAFTNLEVGQWFKLTAPSDAANGAYLKVASRTTTVITVDAATPIPGTGTRAAVANCVIKSSRLKNGVTQRSFTVEKEFADVGQFFAFRGMTASEFSLEFASGQILGGSINFMGKDSQQATATFLPGTPVASQTYDVMNAVSGVGNIMEAGVALTGQFIKSLSLSVNNGLREQTAIGTMGSVAIAAGTLNVSGDIELYLADGTMYNKFRNNTATSLSFSAKDGSGNGYVIVLPKIKFTSMQVQAGGLDSDVMLAGGYQALMGAVEGKTLIIYRL